MGRIVLFSGGGDYRDPWHSFAQTSARVAEILRGAGHEVLIVDTVHDLEAALPVADALVVNAGGGGDPHPLDGRLEHVLSACAAPLLALHVSATLLPESDAWEAMLGGRWVRGVSMHPDLGPMTVRAVSPHPVVADWTEWSTVDEAYSWLRVGEGVEVLLVHDFEGIAHPLCWVGAIGGRRVAYDALGHDVEAYESPAAADLVARLAGWILQDANGSGRAPRPKGPSPVDSGL